MKKTIIQATTVLVVSATSVLGGVALADGPFRAGRCANYGDGVVVCVPWKAPDRSKVVRIYEDGSAGYGNGWIYDPETKRFRR